MLHALSGGKIIPTEKLFLRSSSGLGFSDLTQYSTVMVAMFAVYGVGGPELLLIFLILATYLVVAGIPAFLAYKVLSGVPPAHRKQQPKAAFLLLIPLLSLIWAFFVHPKVAESLKSYFDSQGDQSVGDCGASMALWLCICAACSWIPVLGFLCGLASLVLLILFYIKAFDLSKRILQLAPPLFVR